MINKPSWGTTDLLDQLGDLHRGPTHGASANAINSGRAYHVYIGNVLVVGFDCSSVIV